MGNKPVVPRVPTASQSLQDSTMNQDKSAEAASTMLNDLALRNTPDSRTNGPLKRKRVESVVEVHPPKKPRAATNSRSGSHQPRAAQETSKRSAGKLGRPGGKALQQFRESTQLAPKKNRSDVYEFTDNSPKKPIIEQTAVRKLRSTQSANVKSPRAPARNATVTSDTDGQSKVPGRKAGRPERQPSPAADNPSISPSEARGGKNRHIAGGENHNQNERAKKKPETPALAQEEGSCDDDTFSSDDGSDFVDANDESTERTPKSKPTTGKDASKSKDTRDPKLLGQDSAWMQILGGARINCLDPERARSEMEDESEEDNMEATVEPVYLTKKIEDLTRNVKKASDLYRHLTNTSEMEMDEDATVGIQDVLNDLEARIEAIKEPQAEIDGSLSQERKKRLAERAKKEASRMIQDIYLRAVPGLVYLLRSAMTCRALHHPQIYDSAGLEEIVKIQELILRLCMKTKAGVWEAKPVTNDPITAPIRSRIVPGLRDSLMKVFAAKLQEVLVQEKRKKNFLEYQSSQQTDVRDSQEDHLVKIQRQNMRIREDILMEREKIRGLSRLGQRGSPQSRQLPSSTDHGAQWTKEEEMELVVQLMNQDSRSLPAKERYLRILNAPLLQNKLPEHVQEQAMCLKSSLIEHFQENFGRIPSWIHSIE